VSPVRALTALAFVAVATGCASAQDPRLAQRLAQPERDSIQAIVDSARAAHLPTEVLVDRALEGAEKGIPGPRIVAAVRTLAAELRRARQALGARSDSDEVKAGAQALHAGAPVGDLSRLRVAGGARRLTMAVTVLTDLVSRRVPSTSASAALVKLLRAGVNDPELRTFQRNVHSDIERGGDPSTVADTRARGMVAQVGGS